MVQSGFYLWAAVAVAMLFFLFNFSERRKALSFGFAGLLLIWLIYIIILSGSDILEDFSLPPRLPLLIVIPAILFIFAITGRDRFRDVLMQTPRHLPVYLQSYRIVVELLIYGAFLEGVFPEKATFKGLNYDILVGLSAPLIAWLYQYRKISDKALLTWNVVSLVVLSLTVYSFISTYYFSDYVQSMNNMDFVKLPYLLLASVLLPVAVFLHIFSLRQLQLARVSKTTA